MKRYLNLGIKACGRWGKLQNGKMSKILNNSSLLNATNFYKMGVKIPIKTILKH